MSQSLAGKSLKWASLSLHRSFSRTRVFLSRQLWVWPILAIVLLSTVGIVVRNAVESTMRANVQSGLQTLLDVESAMLVNWLEMQEANASLIANDRQFRELTHQMLDLEEAEAIDSTQRKDLQKQISHEIGPALSHHGYLGFAVLDKSRTVLASSFEAAIGVQQQPKYDDLLRKVFLGETIVTPPFASEIPLEDRAGKIRTGVPSMFACAPIRDENLQVIAALALRLDPEKEFSEILQLGRLGQTGETYAFNREGQFLSRSRFEEELVLLGLLPDQPDATSILSLDVRDPQLDLTEGGRAKVRRSKLPLTFMATEAVANRPGANVDGYRDYRGVTVVGAWTWLPEYQLGVATEIDAAEAYRPLYILRRVVWSIYALLGLASVAIFVFTLLIAKANRAAQEAAIEAKQLGQYQLDQKLGAGGMGVVYLGQHAMLRRPAAIKMLSPERTSDDAVQRFEREVQLTCQLNHPNTVMIYDYGRTPEGVFYYAMEYLDGINLQDLIERYGPQPEARVVNLLHQMCGSLYEAHLAGLVHRDIKPGNIMLNRRGGECDVVKVLDFGLAKALDADKQSELTAANSLTGTPLYLSPEAIQTPNLVDGRSDLYAVGAVGYYLLTGQPVFQSDSLVDLCQKHVSQIPVPPSERLGKPVSVELEHAILSCLEKQPGRRPQTARELAQRLEHCPTWHEWTFERAEAWWQRHERGEKPTSNSMTPSTPHDRTIIGSME
ncbi:protein kinase [bacterium]|nr:protein kinase [bacterium]